MRQPSMQHVASHCMQTIAQIIFNAIAKTFLQHKRLQVILTVVAEQPSQACTDQ